MSVMPGIMPLRPQKYMCAPWGMGQLIRGQAERGYARSGGFRARSGEIEGRGKARVGNRRVRGAGATKAPEYGRGVGSEERGTREGGVQVAGQGDRERAEGGGRRTLSMRVKISSEYSATLSWMYILPPSLFFCSRESA